MRLQIFIGDFLCQKLPKHDAVGPHVHSLRARLVPYNFWGHPGDGACEAHYSAYIIPFFACAEVTDLHHEIISHKDAKNEYFDYNPLKEVIIGILSSDHELPFDRQRFYENWAR